MAGNGSFYNLQCAFLLRWVCGVRGEYFGIWESSRQFNFWGESFYLSKRLNVWTLVHLWRLTSHVAEGSNSVPLCVHHSQGCARRSTPWDFGSSGAAPGSGRSKPTKSKSKIETWRKHEETWKNIEIMLEVQNHWGSEKHLEFVFSLVRNFEQITGNACHVRHLHVRPHGQRLCCHWIVWRRLKRRMKPHLWCHRHHRHRSHLRTEFRLCPN